MRAGGRAQDRHVHRVNLQHVGPPQHLGRHRAVDQVHQAVVDVDLGQPVLGGRSVRRPALTRTSSAVSMESSGDEEVDVVLRLRPTPGPPRVAAAERERDVGLLQLDGHPLEHFTHVLVVALCHAVRLPPRDDGQSRWAKRTGAGSGSRYLRCDGGAASPQSGRRLTQFLPSVVTCGLSAGRPGPVRPPVPGCPRSGR